MSNGQINIMCIICSLVAKRHIRLAIRKKQLHNVVYGNIDFSLQINLYANEFNPFKTKLIFL